MNQVTITTHQHVNLAIDTAAFAERFYAALIDSFIQFILLILSFIGLIAVFAEFYSDFNEEDGRFIMVALLIYLLAYVISSLYMLITEWTMNGQTFGKKIVKIKVVLMDGGQPGFINYLIRWVFRIPEFFLTGGALAVISFLLNGKGQRLGDLAAGTTVIRLKQETTLNDTAFSGIDKEYTPVFPQVNSLSTHDIEIIKEVLYDKSGDRSRELHQRMCYELKDSIQKKTGIQSDFFPENFLRIVIKDYNFYQGRL